MGYFILLIVPGETSVVVLIVLCFQIFVLFESYVHIFSLVRVTEWSPIGE